MTCKRRRQEAKNAPEGPVSALSQPGVRVAPRRAQRELGRASALPLRRLRGMVRPDGRDATVLAAQERRWGHERTRSRRGYSACWPRRWWAGAPAGGRGCPGSNRVKGGHWSEVCSDSRNIRASRLHRGAEDAPAPPFSACLVACRDAPVGHREGKCAPHGTTKRIA